MVVVGRPGYNSGWVIPRGISPTVRYVSMGLRQEEDIIQPMKRMTSSGDRHQDCRVQVQVEHHEEIKCLNLAIHCGVNGLVKMCQRVAHP